MRSKAHLKSHPLHPLLIGFPISFFFGAFVFDVLYVMMGDASLQTTGYHMVIAGIIGAVMAAVPGFIDFLFVVPPDSSAKKRAAKHGLLNTTNLVLFIVVFLLKRNNGASINLIIVLEAVGIIILSVAGWLGGTLVYRNQIGVDIRYADAGKWKEETISQESGEIEVAKSKELEVNQMKLFRIKGQRIVIARSEKGYVAFNDHCTHKGGSLAGGSMICGTVQCPWHGSQFDVVDGSVKAGPAKEKIEVYAVKEKDGMIYLDLNQIKK